ncbi:hypothetical protein SAMN04244574_00303 [Azotobacter beijerinckii]|uniref:Transposase n=1 Tax=Azotobacter beijerinckii TaxID=170623 RepID=A0A1I3YWR0_9GAMM|nr:hypothetical protein SAMN04244571_00276 [Azotobacter beijerinckii]SFK36322.1 hypothetical protein SAMN04244574_00303 [Azotobacter beijerinckii]
MPRIGRIVLPNYPCHVVQRGHNRQVVFAETTDFKRYLSDLKELKDAFALLAFRMAVVFCEGEAVVPLAGRPLLAPRWLCIR